MVTKRRGGCPGWAGSASSFLPFCSRVELELSQALWPMPADPVLGLQLVLSVALLGLTVPQQLSGRTVQKRKTSDQSL